jgi:L-alanine-DL-glutamate epimerase-like enolase superfamily enzyme
MPWTLRLYEETPVIEDGEMVVPDKPGLGLKFSEAAIKQYQVS